MTLALLLACRPPDLETLQDPAACASCHPDHTEEWSGSMHAYSSIDPLFRTLNAIGQRETGGELGDFCVNCHAPLAVELGLTEDGLNLDELPDAVQGVNCYFCHVVDGVDGEHNNPLSLARDGVMRGGFDDPVSNAFHASKYSPLLDRGDLRSSRACGSCHDIVTPAGVHIERTFEEWKSTLYAREGGNALSCSACHMKGVDGAVAVQGDVVFPERRRHQHTFPAVDVALTPFPQMDEQRALVQDELDGVVGPQLCVTTDPVGGDTTVVVDLENLAAGHSFPSGAAADRRVWVELVAEFEGEEVYVSGRVPEGEAVDEVPDPTRWEFRDRHFDATGLPTHFFWEVDSLESELLVGPGAREPSDPNWVETHQLRTYTLEETAVDRVQLRMFMRPFPLDLAESLESEGLDPSVRDAIPTFSLGSASLEWTTDLGQPCVR